MSAPARPRTIRAGSVEIGLGSAAMAIGAAVWLAVTAARTGGDAFVAAATNAAFVGLLLVVTSFTRSVGTRLAVRLFLIGGGIMTLAILLAELSEVVIDASSASRDVFVPLMEETLKLAPLLFLVRRWRDGRRFALGASDLLVMGAAVGAGFALVEDAFIRDAFGWGGTVALFPTTERVLSVFGDRLISGHAVWAALAGGGLGLGVLLFGFTARGYVVGLAGAGVSLLDHIANNMTADGRWGFLHDVVLGGWLTFAAFLVVAIACVLVDLKVVATALPKDEALSTPGFASDPAGLQQRFIFGRLRRGLAFAAYRYDRMPAEARRAPHGVLVSATTALLRRRAAALGPQAE